MTEDQKTYSRATRSSLAGLGIQVLIAAAFLILALWSKHLALWEAAWHALAGIPLWICLWIVYQQHRLERIEALEAEQLERRHGGDTSIFETAIDDLSVARKRLAWLYRWIVPAVSLITSIYLIVFGVILTNRALNAWEADTLGALPESSGLLLAFCAGIAIVGFLMSRYLAGMARVPQWQLLRGGAAYLMGSVLIAAALVLTIALAKFDMPTALAVVSVVVPIFMVLIGIEIALNFVLDFYRPRRPGELPRPAFDSRLLSLFTAPESIAKTVNEAINYQFGFEITRSWFWQLLSRAFGWLIVFGVIVLLLMSCFVIVEPHQQALVTRFGKLASAPLNPGMHLKLPWPISRVEYYNVTQVRSITIGSEGELRPGMPILWTDQHTENKPEPLLVAPSRLTAAERVLGSGGGGAAADAPANSLMNAEVLLYYRVAPGKLLQNVMANPDAGDERSQDKRLRQLAEMIVSRYLLQHEIDAWIGAQRGTSGPQMAQQIQRAADARNLGVEVLSVAITGVHPPQEVADAFHEVVGAEQERLTQIQTARQQAVRHLSEVAGSTEVANRILAEIEKLEQMSRGDTPREQVIQQEQLVERLVVDAGGKAAVNIAQARADRWELENRERGRVSMFAPQLEAYLAAPDYFRAKAYIDVLAEALKDQRKMVIVGDRERLWIKGDFKDTPNAFGSFTQTLEQQQGINY